MAAAPPRTYTHARTHTTPPHAHATHVCSPSAPPAPKHALLHTTLPSSSHSKPGLLRSCFSRLLPRAAIYITAPNTTSCLISQEGEERAALFAPLPACTTIIRTTQNTHKNCCGGLAWSASPASNQAPPPLLLCCRSARARAEKNTVARRARFHLFSLFFFKKRAK